MAKYVLKCVECGKEYEDDSFRLRCDEDHEPALLRTIYRKKELTVKDELPGMFKFADYLPVGRVIDCMGAPLTYKSERLGKYLGLEKLYVIFNGYWPEKGAFMETASFKELEAPSVLARVPKDCGKTIVVASAGNTGRAFARICSENGLPLVLVIPQQSADQIWNTKPFSDSVKLILAGGNSDYFDAITLAGKLVGLNGFFPEGGAFNVARRDGMGTTVLDFAATVGEVPKHYFQAIGSGTGGIAAWEAYLRLAEEGRYGNGCMTLHLSQNHPFVPITESWADRLPEIPASDPESDKMKITETCAKVLTNRKPPYALRGGVYDVLCESSGRTYAVTNTEAYRAMSIFEKFEGIDICHAAGVAVGSLMQAVENGIVASGDLIALNITGGGERKVKTDYDLHYLEPIACFSDGEIGGRDAVHKLEALFAGV
ncbi:MAG: cysteate synthase [Spirochaetes bacterium]|nr:cysteate synthase [Spirochaetota bacterium]